ncbi:MAG TPA: DUF2617 family protein [Actinocrinis sp.]|nr:DUF2617 family protein [Actinocrinis sp.]
MVVELDVGYCDTRAEDLGWSLDLGPQPALAVRDLAGDGGLGIQLRLLGASHQVVVRAGPGRADPGPDLGPVCLETLACLPDQAGPVPAETLAELGRWRYTFTSHVGRHGPAEFLGLVGAIEREAHSGILGRYPGAPGAVTAVSLLSRGSDLRWSTWHTYPQQGAIVTTHSTLRMVGGHGERAGRARRGGRGG